MLVTDVKNKQVLTQCMFTRINILLQRFREHLVIVKNKLFITFCFCFYDVPFGLIVLRFVIESL